MLLLRAMPKHIGTVVILGFLIPMSLALCVFVYTNRYLDSDYLDTLLTNGNIQQFLSNSKNEDRSFQDAAFSSSLAYKKQEELDQIDEEEDTKAEPNEDIKPFQTIIYKESLKRTADQYGKIMIKFCEDGRIDSAINFHETSIVRNDISHILYIAPDIRLCMELWKLEIKCHVLEDEFMYFNSTQPTKVQHNLGKRVAIARLKLILIALTSGYTVLFTDMNTLYLKDPTEYIQCDDQCDVAVSVDNISLNYANWAVHLAKPRRATVYMYARVLTILGTTSAASSKEILNSLLADMATTKQIAVQYLDAEKFAPASYFFNVRRFYDDKSRCRTCVAIIEDRGLSKQDHIYQMKEAHLWHANFDEYYSSRRRLYILYENVWEYAERRSIVQELTALRNALAIGQALGRIVILPKFHCPESLFEMKFCGLSDFIKMTYFDEKFSGLYRENTFLDHPKVSREVRRTVTDAYYIGESLPNEDWDKDADIRPRHKILYIDPERSRGLYAEEFESTFRAETSYNLLFHSLYDGFAGFQDKQDTIDFNKKIKHAFRLSTPVQIVVGDKSFELPV